MATASRQLDPAGHGTASGTVFAPLAFQIVCPAGHRGSCGPASVPLEWGIVSLASRGCGTAFAPLALKIFSPALDSGSCGTEFRSFSLEMVIVLALMAFVPLRHLHRSLSAQLAMAEAVATHSVRCRWRSTQLVKAVSLALHLRRLHQTSLPRRQPWHCICSIGIGRRLPADCTFTFPFAIPFSQHDSRRFRMSPSGLLPVLSIALNVDLHFLPSLCG